jgi:hypothetical protein
MKGGTIIYKLPKTSRHFMQDSTTEISIFLTLTVRVDLDRIWGNSQKSAKDPVLWLSKARQQEKSRRR